MSEFMRKTLSGQTTSAAEWNAHLLEYHRLIPGGTPRALASYRTGEGRTSYELLVDVVAQARQQRGGRFRVLDLACGDGYLIELCLRRLGEDVQIMGIDMSEGELDAARERLRGRDVLLVQERAQSLSLADGSVDVAICQMALLLMQPVEPVVTEIARVLTERGVFSAVIGPARLSASRDHAHERTESQSALTHAVGELMGEFWKEAFPEMSYPSISDPRVMSQAGLAELFREDLGYARPVMVKDIDLILDTSVDGLWDFFAATYVVAFLDEEVMRSLESRMKALFRQHQEAYGTLQFPLPLSHITVHKQG